MAGYLSSSYRVIQSTSVAEALELALAEVPDIVLCDILLPDGSGFDVVRQIKNDRATDHIPVVIMTALADEESRNKGLEFRADAYLTKPFERTVLKTTLENLIHDRRNVLRHAAISVWNEKWDKKVDSQGSNHDFTRRFMVALEDHYANPACDVDTLARALAMSRRALERKTRQYLAMTPNELLAEFRLQHATRMLKKDLRIVDVSLACGFGTQSHFSAVFKKRFGTTPSDFARRAADQGR